MYRFPVLTVIAAILRFVGWLLVAAGIVMLIASMFSGRRGLLGPMESAIIGGIAVLNGLGVAALGECIGVLFAIEENTRESAEHAQALRALQVTTNKARAA